MLRLERTAYVNPTPVSLLRMVSQLAGTLFLSPTASVRLLPGLNLSLQILPRPFIHDYPLHTSSAAMAGYVHLKESGEYGDSGSKGCCSSRDSFAEGRETRPLFHLWYIWILHAALFSATLTLLAWTISHRSPIFERAHCGRELTYHSAVPLLHSLEDPRC